MARVTIGRADVNPNSGYNVRVRSVDADGRVSPPSDSIYVPAEGETAMVLPPGPINLKTTVDGQFVTITWDPQPDARIYRVEYKLDTGTQWLGRYGYAGDNEWVSPKLNANTVYNFRVRSENFIGISDWSEQQNVRTGSAPTTAPTGSNAAFWYIISRRGAFRVKANIGRSAAEKFRCRYRVKDTTTWTTDPQVGDLTEWWFDITHTSDRQEFEFQVQLGNSHGWASTWSDSQYAFSIYNNLPDPDPPAKLEISDVTATSMLVEAPNKSDDFFTEIRIREVESAQYLHRIIFASAPEIRVSGLTAAKTYVLDARLVINRSNDPRKSEYGDIQYVVTGSTSGATLAVPTNLVATEGQNGSVLIAWSLVSGATAYQIEYQTRRYQSWVRMPEADTFSGQAVLVGAYVKGMQFRIRAKNGDTLSAWSSQVAVTFAQPVSRSLVDSQLGAIPVRFEDRGGINPPYPITASGNYAWGIGPRVYTGLPNQPTVSQGRRMLATRFWATLDQTQTTLFAENINALKALTLKTIESGAFKGREYQGYITHEVFRDDTHNVKVFIRDQTVSSDWDDFQAYGFPRTLPDKTHYAIMRVHNTDGTLFAAATFTVVGIQNPNPPAGDTSFTQRTIYFKDFASTKDSATALTDKNLSLKLYDVPVAIMENSIAQLNYWQGYFYWTAVAGAVGYDVRYRPDDSTAWTYRYDIDVVHYEASSVLGNPGTGKRIEVRAHNGEDASEWVGADYTGTRTLTGIPKAAAISNFEVAGVAAAHTQLLLKWDKVPDGTSFGVAYTVDRYELWDGINNALIDYVTATDYPEYLLENLPAGVLQRIEILAYGTPKTPANTGIIFYSNIDSYAITPYATALPLPNLTLDNPTNNSFRVNVTITSPATGTRCIWRRVDTARKPLQAWQTDYYTTNQNTIGSLVSGAWYEVRIKAEKGASSAPTASSDWSDSVFIQTTTAGAISQFGPLGNYDRWTDSPAGFGEYRWASSKSLASSANSTPPTGTTERFLIVNKQDANNALWNIASLTYASTYFIEVSRGSDIVRYRVTARDLDFSDNFYAFRLRRVSGTWSITKDVLDDINFRLLS